MERRDDDRRMDDGAFLYYKLTYELKGSGELIIVILIIINNNN